MVLLKGEEETVRANRRLKEVEFFISLFLTLYTYGISIVNTKDHSILRNYFFVGVAKSVCWVRSRFLGRFWNLQELLTRAMKQQ